MNSSLNTDTQNIGMLIDIPGLGYKEEKTAYFVFLGRIYYYQKTRLFSNPLIYHYLTH